MRIFSITLLVVSSTVSLAQSGKLTVQQAIDIALKNNAGIKAAANEIDHQKQLKKNSFDLPKTELSLMYGQYNSYAKSDNNITFAQTIPFSALGSQGAFNRAAVTSSELKKAVTENELIYQVKQVYYQLLYLQTRHVQLVEQDSLYEGFLKSASLRFKTGEANLLEKTTAETQRNEIKNNLRQSEADVMALRLQLKSLLNSETLPEILDTPLIALQSGEIGDTTIISANPSLSFVRHQIDVADRQRKLEIAKSAPDLKVGFFSQTLIGTPDPETGNLASGTNRFTGFQIGVSFPLWIVPYQGRIKAASFSKMAAENNYRQHQAVIQAQWQQALQQFEKNKSSLAYYQTSALPNAELILKQSQIAFRSGEIGYAEYLLGVRSAIGIKESHLQTLNDYNQSIVYIEFLSGNK